jgi:hypothetical protein
MRYVFACLLWTLVFLVLLIGIDQLLVRVPFTSPAPLAVATFYRDLRSRVINLTKGMTTAPGPSPAKQTKPLPTSPGKAVPPASIEGVIEQHQTKPATAATPAPAVRAPAGDAAPRYLYADDQGELHFAETLAEVPARFRAQARVLGE